MQMVAFLGGINVGGHRVSMERLRAEFSSLGYEDVRTFIASGNVIFDTTGRSGTIEQRIEAHLGAQLGYAVPTFVRRAATVGEIAQRAPFGPVPAGHSLHVVFLRRPPTSAAAHATEALSTPHDRFCVEGNQLYWQIRGGMSDTRIKAKVLAAAHGQQGTSRNITSVRKLVAVL